MGVDPNLVPPRSLSHGDDDAQKGNRVETQKHYVCFIGEASASRPQSRAKTTVQYGEMDIRGQWLIWIQAVTGPEH